jgi:hypothetical protein
MTVHGEFVQKYQTNPQRLLPVAEKAVVHGETECHC